MFVIVHLLPRVTRVPPVRWLQQNLLTCDDVTGLLPRLHYIYKASVAKDANIGCLFCTVVCQLTIPTVTHTKLCQSHMLNIINAQ